MELRRRVYCSASACPVAGWTKARWRAARICATLRPMAFHASSTTTLLLLAPLLAWRIHARFRRLIGRQRLSKYRAWVTLAIFPALLLLLAWAARGNPAALGLLSAGGLAGAALGVFGLRCTRFEPTRQGLFYTPDARLGVALMLLFVGRLAWRLLQAYVLEPQADHGLADFVRSPLTLTVFGLLAGYYIAYAIGLARWRMRVLRAKRQREAREALATPPAGEDAAPR